MSASNFSILVGAVISSDPFEEMKLMQEKIDRIFAEFHKKMLKDDIFKGINFDKRPLMDLKDLKDHYEIKVDMPGVDKDGVKISVKDRVLKIEAKREESKELNSSNFIKQERFVSNYVKMITLPKDANEDKLKSGYKNGVLTITIPKK